MNSIAPTIHLFVTKSFCLCRTNIWLFIPKRFPYNSADNLSRCPVVVLQERSRSVRGRGRKPVAVCVGGWRGDLTINTRTARHWVVCRSYHDLTHIFAPTWEFFYEEIFGSQESRSRNKWIFHSNVCKVTFDVHLSHTSQKKKSMLYRAGISNSRLPAYFVKWPLCQRSRPDRSVVVIALVTG